MLNLISRVYSQIFSCPLLCSGNKHRSPSVLQFPHLAAGTRTSRGIIRSSCCRSGRRKQPVFPVESSFTPKRSPTSWRLWGLFFPWWPCAIRWGLQNVWGRILWTIESVVSQDRRMVWNRETPEQREDCTETLRSLWLRNLFMCLQYYSTHTTCPPCIQHELLL